MRAVREAIINGVTHRSYMDDSCMQVSIYDDRVEVYSPGMLYGGLDLSEALRGKSKCRNAAISEAFHYMKIIEAWGTGLGRIRNSCKEYGLPDPVIEESGDGFRVISYRKTANTGQNAGGNIESNQEIGNSSIESSTEIIESNTKNDTENYNGSIENRLVELLIQYPAITQQEAAEKLGYPKAWIRRIMKKMQQEGILRREGSTKKGIWIVIR